MDVDDPSVCRERAIAIAEAILPAANRQAQRLDEDLAIVRMLDPAEGLERIVVRFEHAVDRILMPQEAALFEIDLPGTDAGGLGGDVEPVEQLPFLLGLTLQKFLC